MVAMNKLYRNRNEIETKNKKRHKEVYILIIKMHEGPQLENSKDIV